MAEEANFCPTCGTAVESETVSAEPVAAPVAAPVSEPVAAPVAEPVAAPVAEPVAEPVAVPVSAPVAAQPAPAPVYMQPQPAEKPITEQDLPEHLRPLSPWKYFGLQVLYSIPVIGFIFLIVFSFKRSNINRRNFTRSYWCALLLGAIFSVGVILAVILLGFGPGDPVHKFAQYLN